MSTWDLLRRDTKLACVSTGSIGERFVCSTVSGLDFVELVSAPDFLEMANRLCTLHSADLLVCITVGHAPCTDNQIHSQDRRRGLIVYSPHSQNNLSKELVEFICQPRHNLDLHEEPVPQAPVTFTGVIRNPVVTRKAILPLLVQFIKRHQSPPAENSTTSGNNPVETDENLPDSNSKSTHTDCCFHPIRSLDPNIQGELNFLRTWLASFKPDERFKLVQDTVSRVMDTVCTEHPSVELLKQVAMQLTEKAHADRDFATKVLSDIGKALSRGRRLTMPATNDLRAYHVNKQKENANKRYRGTSDDSYSLPDQENTKPSWLEVDRYLMGSKSF
ncbi:unnamed protein product [Echinostoma caproni]|uniref:Uncharacterized protein n=1 Tax=Echinostoma caproni TaxID=27848 RepID=A0A3P8H4J5_9TREM|nr:unnamed protein product [Echinostoma caproni]